MTEKVKRRRRDGSLKDSSNGRLTICFAVSRALEWNGNLVFTTRKYNVELKQWCIARLQKKNENFKSAWAIVQNSRNRGRGNGQSAKAQSVLVFS